MAAVISVNAVHGIMREMSGQIKGQISIFDYLSQIKECKFSGHTCNKRNLWDVALTLDDIICPLKCCRECEQWLCGARCNGADVGRIYPVEIKGLMDDPYCPKCGYGFWDYGKQNEVDCEKCPSCGIRINWEQWHRVNDKEEL